MTKITQADRNRKKIIQQRFLTDGISHSEVLDEELAAHREAAFEAGREAERRAMVEWLRAEARLCDCFAREAIATTIKNKEHRNDAD